MPTDKRARQRAGAQARREAMARQKKRRRQIRSSIVVAIVAVVVVGSVYLITRHSPTPTVPATPQGKLDAIAVKAGCPASTSTRANNLSFATAPKLSISTTATYHATVKTDVGSFVISLDPKEAPTAVNSFVFLANQGFFNCVIFHRVIPGFVDQTGDPTGTGTGGPGYQFTEAGPPTASPQYPIGSVAMANSNQPATTKPTTNGSQWFVVTGSQGESLQPDYVLFGQVTSGMNVVQKINTDGTSAGTPKLTHRILSVKIKEA
ncbi:MAG TPA: peptidylprolyl isomerase [Acidimicrobiales bacterium]|nr:peptidylprolyl isomerase [Acidimicrobiales bacterium]